MTLSPGARLGRLQMFSPMELINTQPTTGVAAQTGAGISLLCAGTSLPGGLEKIKIQRLASPISLMQGAA